VSADRRVLKRLALDCPAYPVIHRHARPARFDANQLKLVASRSSRWKSAAAETTAPPSAHSRCGRTDGAQTV